MEQLVKAHRIFAKGAGYFQHPFLLLIRCYWGYQFFLTGMGKFRHMDKTIEFFSSLNIPYPMVNAWMAASTECGCGILLMIGLFSRVAAIPLTVTMIVAYSTAHHEQLMGIFSNTKEFIDAEPFTFLLASVVIMLFGPGAISTDRIIDLGFLRNRSSL